MKPQKSNNLLNNFPSASDINNYIVGNVNYITQKTLPQYQLEQVELRKYLCSPCLENGKCHMCGCKTPNMFYAPLKKDSNSKWAEFMSEAQWNSLKENYIQYAKFFEILQAAHGSSSLSPAISENDN